MTWYKLVQYIMILTVMGILIFIGSNFGPVWFQRLIVFSGYSYRMYYPQWINNEEYCYLAVESFFDYGLGFSGISKDFFDPLKFFRSPNATFYIYKVNINQPQKEKLIKKITKKVDFYFSEGFEKDAMGNFIFRYLDEKKFSLIIKDRNRYVLYYINSSGKIVKTKQISYKNKFSYDSMIADISFDGKKYLIYRKGLLYIEDVDSKQKSLFLDKTHDFYYSSMKWVSENMLLIYRFFALNKKEHWKDSRCEVYLIDEKKRKVNMVYSNVFKEIEEIVDLMLDGALSFNGKFLFLSKIGIFQKQGEDWQIIKDFSDMKDNYYYPDISPDASKVIGVANGVNLQILDFKKLIK